ncbi:uncharacterized protein LOC109202383 isoform X2 [Oreochromis niloticus]|uniref:uncharacterized protein LOC109202383 isoform X2 n=3 Tax=Oreochromis niloticus TaxID=8128 RepID=UPI000DF3C60A|nr:uncharacterized protein LOC109202383 isoform X2 [Oreochromis niloticus]
MEPDEYKILVAYKLKGEYPALFTKKEKFLLRRKAAIYDIEGEQLFYWRYKGTDKTIKTTVVCGADEANTIFSDFHASPTGAHCGQTKTREAISKRFYWPGMSVDINNWVSQCALCQASAATIKKPAEYIPIKVSQPFELVGMDLIGKLTETNNGHQYICVFIDYFTKWPQAYPLKSKSAGEVTNCLIKFVHQFEAPKRILTDQGKEFVNSLNKRVCGLLKIKRSLCSPYHPQTNGLVEKMNGTIQRALCKVVGDQPEMWDEYLDAVMFGLRTKKQVTTKYSPYYLMFGREARYPSEIPEEFMVDESVEDIVGQEELSEDIQKHQKLLELVKDNVVKAQEKTKGKIKMMTRDVVFKVGDKVLRANIRSQQRKGGKLEANFLGPYIITAIQGKSADLQDSNGTIIPKVNIDQLKLSKDSMPRVPHRGSKKTAATLPTAQPGPAAPQAAAAPASALASQATAAPVAVAPPPPPPRATQPTAPMASLTSLSVQTQHPSPVPQGIAITVSDPESGATAQKENEPATSATAPEYATAVQTESQTAADPASKTITADQASQTTTADQASQTTTADPASQTTTADQASQTTTAADPASQTTTAADPSSQTTAPNATTTQASAPQITAQQSTAQTMEATVPLVTPAPATATQASPAPPPASPSQRYTEPVAEKYIMDAWAGKSPHVLLSKIGAYKLFYWDIQQIGPDMELESESINAYLAIMVRQCNRHNSAKAAFIDSFSMTAIWKRKAPRLKIKPMEHEVILGIVNEHHHWTLVVIYPQEKKSLYLDPLGETKQGIQNCLESTRAFMRKKGCNVSRWTCDTVKHPKQLDATSCGVFALKFAEKILQKESIDFPSTKKAINTHRLQIATTLLLR